MEDEIGKLREEIEYYRENDGKYVVTTSKNGETIRKLINYEEYLMHILDLEIEEYAKVFEKEEDEKNIITYILFEIYALIKYPVLLDFNKFIRYLEKNRKLVESTEEIMAKLSMCYKLLDSNRVIDKKDILSFLSEGYKGFAEADNTNDIYIKVVPKDKIIKIIEEDEIIDEIDTVLRFLIYKENENNTVYKKEKLRLKILENNEEKSLFL